MGLIMRKLTVTVEPLMPNVGVIPKFLVKEKPNVNVNRDDQKMQSSPNQTRSVAFQSGSTHATSEERESQGRIWAVKPSVLADDPSAERMSATSITGLRAHATVNIPVSPMVLWITPRWHHMELKII